MDILVMVNFSLMMLQYEIINTCVSRANTKSWNCFFSILIVFNGAKLSSKLAAQFAL